MQQKLSEELIAFSSMMLMASSRGEMVRLSSKMNELVEQAMQLERCELHKQGKNIIGNYQIFTRRGCQNV